MQRWKRFLHNLIFPHAVVVIMLVPVAAVLLIYSFVGHPVQVAVEYGSYTLSAYALTILCAKVPGIYKSANTFRKNNPYIVRYQADISLRVKISLYGSVGMNLAYALMQLVSGLYYHSVWFYALSGYHALLTIIRGFLLRDARKEAAHNIVSQWKRYRFTGILLVMMNFSLVVIVFYIVWQNRGFSYHSIHTITMAVYTFTITTMAIVNVIRYRRYNRPLLSAAVAISLAAALVSMLSLETAMLSAFGSAEEAHFRQVMTASTGAGVSLIILIMAIYMIRRSTKALRRIKGNEELTNGTEQ